MELAQMPSFLASALAGRSDDDLRQRPEPEMFSLVEHACHLRDLEREGYQVRVRRILGEDLPDLPGFDGDAVAKSRNYPAEDAHAAARAFAQARAELLSEVSALTPAQRAREGTFAGRRITIADLLDMMRGHDGEHARDIEALLAKSPMP